MAGDQTAPGDQAAGVRAAPGETAAAAMRCQPPTVNGRYLLSVLVDGSGEDSGKPGDAQTGKGGGERVAAKPEELVSLAGMICPELSGQLIYG